jgi:SanA protein
MKRKITLLFLISSILILAVVLVCNNIVTTSTRIFLYEKPGKIPGNKVGVVLGTTKYLKNGKINEYWANRINATVELFRLSKINYIIISGDNSRSSYDEPTDMKEELVKNGIPDSLIYLDYAGFRTFDSMIRAQKIFGQDKFTVISQRFHNERAIYIARHYGILAIGYNAKDVDSYSGFKTKMREKIARVKLFLDFLFDKQPKFLGEKIIIK